MLTSRTEQQQLLFWETIRERGRETQREREWETQKERDNEVYSLSKLRGVRIVLEWFLKNIMITFLFLGCWFSRESNFLHCHSNLEMSVSLALLNFSLSN